MAETHHVINAERLAKMKSGSVLINTAREIAERVSVSIFLNPTQFGPDEDFEAYPRPLEADLEICRDLQVDVVFTPDTALVYPGGFKTTVHVSGFGEGLCGRYRPGHFDGVTTIDEVVRVLVDDEEVNATVTSRPGGIDVTLWRRVVQTGTYIQIVFRGKVFLDRTRFEVRAVDRRFTEGLDEEAAQFAEAGDATGSAPIQA